jgi:hypothetical protein
MALLTPEAKQNAKPFINALWTALVVCVMVTLACNYIIKGWPPYVAWLQPIGNLVILLGVIGIGLIVADRNKLVK